MPTSLSQVWLGFKSWIFAFIPSSIQCPVAVVDTGKVHIHYPAHTSQAAMDIQVFPSVLHAIKTHAPHQHYQHLLRKLPNTLATTFQSYNVKPFILSKIIRYHFKISVSTYLKHMLHSGVNRNYSGKKPQTVFKRLFMNPMKILDHTKLHWS